MSVTSVEVAAELRPCEAKGWTSAEVMRFLEADLRPRGVTLTAGTSPKAAAELEVIATGCAGGAPSAVISVRDRLTQKIVTRGLSLIDTEVADQARWVALSSAELLRASWAEAASAEYQSVVERVSRMGDKVTLWVRPTAASAGAPDTATKPDLRPHVSLQARTLFAPAYRASLAGGALLASKAFAGGLGFHSGVEALWGDTRDTAGNVQLRLTSVVLGGAVRADLSSRLAVSLGPTLRVGALALSADATPPNTNHDALGGFVSAGLSASAQAYVSSYFSLMFGTEMSHTLLGVRGLAEGRAAAGLSGTFFVASMGLAWRM